MALQHIIYNTLSDVSPYNFEAKAITLFNYQYHNVPIYNAYVHQLGINPAQVIQLAHIPYLPIQFFKNNIIITSGSQAQITFTSSGTTTHTQAHHYVAHEQLYIHSFMHTFKLQYGNPQQYCIIGLLPSYSERTGSSLIYMADYLIHQTNHVHSGYYLHNYEALYHQLLYNEATGTATLLFGVTFALLAFAAKYSLELKHTTIIETGGMKGKGKELTRNQLYATLHQSFGTRSIHSEYGCTELLSQAYATQHGLYTPPPYLKALIRATDDPMLVSSQGKGMLNFIDLANVYSCAFIATDDVGEVSANGQFTVLGRQDYSDVRGCSQLTL